MKKIIAYILIFCFIISAIPPQIVLANRQSPVTNLQISDYTVTQQTGYSIRLNWDRPVDSTVSDPNAVPADRAAIHKFEDYDILYRNATKGESYNAVYGTVKSTDKSVGMNLPNATLQSGSLYAFKVSPYHTHQYARGNDTETRLAPMDYSNSTDAEALYLTDIHVEAQGVGSELHVTWDNPTFDGKEIFEGYRIYYYQGGSELDTIPNTYYSRVSMNSADLIRTDDGRLQYVIKDSTLKVGKYYAVKVEPIVNSRDMRIDKINSIDIGGKTYSISYKSASNEYRVNEAYIKPALYLKEEGLDYINLYWDSKKTDLADILEIRIMSSDNPDFSNSKIIGTIYKESVRDVNNWIEFKPTTKTYYKYLIIYRDPETGGEMQMESEVVVYDPSYTSFEPYVPNILDVTDNKEKPLYLDILWEAFLRNPYDETERKNLLSGFNKYLDRDVKYDIWITDDINNFNDTALNAYKIDTIHGTSLSIQEFTGADGIKKVAYDKQYSSYVMRMTDGSYKIVPLEDNKVYYIKIVATRDTGEVSKTAIGTYYIPPIDEINKQPIMISKPPLRIKKDENGIDIITQNSIDIEWNLKWVEIYDKDTNSWYSRVAVDSNGNLLYGDQIKNSTPQENIIDFSSQDYANLSFSQAAMKIKGDLASLGITDVNSLAFREQDLKNASYEISVVKYDDMIKMGYDAYLEMLNKDDSKWKQITPDMSGEYPFYTVDGLDENTTYVIFFRPYYMDGENKKTAYLPNFVMGTTLSLRPGLEIKPTVPSIETVSVTDTTATVRWIYSEELGYDLWISENSADYPNGGILISWEDMKNIGTIKTENGKKYFYYTIEELFPDTEYLAWLKSFAENGGTKTYSEFSNPTYIRTNDMDIPDPPNGLGIASGSSVNAYNKENNSGIFPAAKDYIVVEWLRDLKDTITGGTKSGEQNPLAQWLNTESIPNTYMVKFNELIANNDYYVRVKTKLTITKTAEGIGLNRYYSYTVQFADNPDFLDAIEITIPTYEFKEEGNNIKSKESEWSVTVKLFSGTTDDEYDGDKNPDFYPLSEDDIEKTFDNLIKTYTMRIKSDGEDAGGNKDYNVDQRLISKFINNDVFEFVLDMTSYQDKTIENRKIQMPYSIFRTLEERKINLVINSENMKITIPHNSFDIKAIKELNGFGYGSYLEINIEKNPKNLPGLATVSGAYTESFVSTAQKITAKIVTPDKIITLDSLSKDILIEMKLINRNSILDNNVAAYRHDGNSGGWQIMNSDYDNAKGIISVYDKRLGTYALIARSVPISTVQNPYEDYLFNVVSKLNITDMQTFDHAKSVTPLQFNNILYAVLKGQKTVAMDGMLDDTAKTALTKSGLLAEGSNVSNEAAVAALIRAYEIKSGSAIKDFQNSGSSVAENASEKYKTAIRKAYKSGLLENDINPKGELNFGEFFYMLDFVLNY